MDPSAATILEEERRFQARRIAEARYAFRWHFPTYVFVNSGLVLIWFFFNKEGFPWPIFPIVFWGLGLTAHYVSAYRTPGQDWIARETDKILRRQQGPAQKPGP